MYVELKNINKTYGSYQASKNVNFGIEKGKLIGLLGPSGSGKTTILRMIAGLETPDSGEIIIDGKVVNDVPASERGIGFVFQNYNLMPILNVYENIVLPIELDGAKIDEAYVERIMDMLKLSEKRYAMPNQLSGGQQQRVAIARALAAKPSIILADEPTGNLDSKTSMDVIALLKLTSKEFAQTIVMITHNEEIATIADRMIRIEDGKIVSSETKGGHADA